MTINFATPGLRILPADAATPRLGGTRKTEPSFGEQLQNAVSGVDQQQQEAESKVGSMLQGKGTDVHDAMISVQKADLSFQLMLQMRNKVVQAYQEIERMQF